MFSSPVRTIGLRLWYFSSFAFLLLLFGASPRSITAEQSVTSQPLPEPELFCEQPFNISVTRISPPSLNFGNDYEIDTENARMQWQSGGKLRVINLDPQTGTALDNGVIVDTGIVRNWPEVVNPILTNGAEWGYSAEGASLYYMKAFGFFGNDRQIFRAIETSPGSWSSEPIPDGASKGFPIPSKEPNAPVTRLYFLEAADNPSPVGYQVGIRDDALDPATETVFPAPYTFGYGGPRWVPGARQIVSNVLDENDVEQVAIYDLDTGQLEYVTHFTAADNVDIDEPWASALPEVGPGVYAVWFLVDYEAFHLYTRSLDGDWELQRIVNPSQMLNKPAKPFVQSPEPLVYNGRAYIMFHLATTVEQVAQPGDIYLMSPGASTSCHFRQVTPDNNKVYRSPEFVFLQDRLGIYYVEQRQNGRTTLYLAETGLAGSTE